MTFNRGKFLHKDDPEIRASAKLNHPKIRILLVTPDQIVQDALKVLIEANFDMFVAASTSLLDDPDQLVKLDEIDIVLIYLTNDDCQPVEMIAELTPELPEVKVIVACAGKDVFSQTRALQLGAVGIIDTHRHPRLLLTAIRQVHEGGTAINQTLLSKLLTGDLPVKGAKKITFGPESATARESDVIELIGEGLSNKEIAKKLKLSEATVRHHLSSLFRKFDVTDRVELVIYAYQNGLLPICEQLKQDYLHHINETEEKSAR